MMQTGDILNCYSNSFLSKLIRKATNSKFSHTALFIEVWGKPYIIDSQKDGTNLRPFDEWQKQYNYTYEVRRPWFEVDKKALSERALSKSGNTAYDFEGLLIRQPWKLISGKFKHEKDAAERMYCSEFVAWVYAVPNYYELSPQDFYEWQLRTKFYKVEN